MTENEEQEICECESLIELGKEELCLCCKTTLCAKCFTNNQGLCSECRMELEEEEEDYETYDCE